jgi:pimeloyl-ACP methyl ester carboxylesterase
MSNDSNTARSFISLRVGRVEIERLRAIDPDRPTLVFLHEGLGSIAQWRDFPARLAQRTGCGALIYSRFGYGRSDPVSLPRPLRYMHDEALVLAELLERTGITEHVLVGHSDGGSIALIYAAHNTTRGLCGVISEAAHVFCEAKTVAAIERARADFVSGELRTALERHHGANTDIAFFGWCDAWLDPAFRDWDIRPELRSIRAPILALQGADDAYGTESQLDAICQQAGAGADARILPHCGHAPHRDQPQVALDAMVTFVERIERGV